MRAGPVRGQVVETGRKRPGHALQGGCPGRRSAGEGLRVGIPQNGGGAVGQAGQSGKQDLGRVRAKGAV